MNVICLLLELYLILIFARIVLSWFPVSSGGALASIQGFVYRLTEPVLGPIRRLIPPVRIGGAGLDISVMLFTLVYVVLMNRLCP